MIKQPPDFAAYFLAFKGMALSLPAMMAVKEMLLIC